MKKFSKLLSILLCLAMVLSFMPTLASADSGSATITFDNTSKRTSVSTESQVWEENGIKVTNNKAESRSDINGQYFMPIRLYVGTELVIEYPGMRSIVFNCNSGKPVSGLTDTLDANGYTTYTTNGQSVTVTLSAAANSFTLSGIVAQFRLDSITVSTSSSAPAPTPTTTTAPSNDPVADSTLSIADAIALGASKEHNTYTAGKYYVTGVITEVYNTTYGNMYITDGNGNTLLIYGTFDADGANRYDAMDVKPVAGDTVTIYGMIGQYNGTPQIKNGWITTHTPSGDPAPTPTDPPSGPSDNNAYTVVTDPAADTAYKFGMIQGNVSATDVYYLTGAMNGYYMGTTTDASAAIDVYLKVTSGGYHLYTKVNGATKYINMVVSGTHVNGAYEDTASTVYTFDAEKQTLIAQVNDEDYWFGTRNDMTYTTVGPVKVSYNGFYLKLYAEADSHTHAYTTLSHDETGHYYVCSCGQADPNANKVAHTDTDSNYACDGGCGWVLAPTAETLTISQAIALGSAHAHNAYTSGKYKVTGVITEVYETTYGNMKITDDAGNILTIYGTYSADGEIRYDALEVKPEVGDTVTIYGIIGQYSDAPQIKNGWIVAHTPAHTHSYSSSVTKAPTCTEKGITTYTCECGHSYTEEMNTIPHDYADATCTEPKTCTVCGHKTGSANGHSWKDATCTEPKTCKICGTKEGNPNGHDWEDATCTEPKTCKVCDATEGTAKGHTWDNSCDTSCNTCGHTRSITHTWNEGIVTKAPTCSEKGSKLFTCSVCGSEKSEDIQIDPEAHDWDNGKITTQATCTEKGVRTHTCKHDSNHTKAVEISVNENNHIHDAEDDGICDDCGKPYCKHLNYTTEVHEATCEDNGYTIYSCSDCTYEWEADYTDATGHVWNEGVVTKEPSCTVKGEKTFTCAHCDKTRIEALDTIEHTWIDATCTADAYCSVCKTAQENTAIGHNYESVITAPTCTTGGHTTHTCANCGHSYVDTKVNALGHSMTKVEAKPATTENEGCITHYICGTCGKWYLDAEGDSEIEDKNSVIIPKLTVSDSATITFDDTNKRTEFSDELQVWTENGITVTNNKYDSVTNIADYFNPVRFYKNSSVTVATSGINSITFYCNDKSYAATLADSLKETDKYTVSIIDQAVHVELNATASSFTVVLTEGQVRLDSIAVNAEAPVPEETEPEETEPEATEPEATEPETSIPSGDDPAADSSLSIKDVIALGGSKEHNTYTEGKYYVTGVITEVYNTMYGNMKITDAEGNILTIYGTYDADGTNRYDAMAVKPVVGDNVTIYGIVGQYNGTPQIKNGWITSHTPGESNPSDPTEPEATVPPTEDDKNSASSSLDAGSLGLENAEVFEGFTSGDISFSASAGENTWNSPSYYTNGDAIRFYSGNSLTISPANGAKIKTITITGVANFAITAENCQLTNGSATGLGTATVVITPADGSLDVVLTNIAASGNFRILSINVSYSGGSASSGGGNVQVPTVNKVTAPVAGTAYKLGFTQAKLGKALYFTGAMDGYYLATSADLSEAVDIYLENVEGGLRLYFMDGSTKTYIDVIPREGAEGKVNVVLTTEPTCVYTFNTTFGTFVTTVEGNDWYLGTYGDYTTISASKTSYIEDTTTIGVTQYPVNCYTVKMSSQTGDTIDLFVALLALSAIGAAVVVTKKKEF